MSTPMPAAFRHVPVDEEYTAADRRDGNWTKLELIEMDRRFCQAMRRAHAYAAPPAYWNPRRRRRPAA
jgi:hypothetical protein